MAIKIDEDLTRDATLSQDKEGVTVERVFCVSGLPLATNTLAQAVFTATDSVSNHRIPLYGEPHPSIAGIYCQHIKATPWAQNSRTNVKVVCTYDWHNYSLPGINGTQIRISATTQLVNANHDEQGNFFIVTYTDANGKVGTNYVALNVPMAQLVVEFQRIETGSPLIKAANYTGAINSDSQFQGVGGPLQWMCRSLGGPSIGNNKYDVTYCMEFSQMGWAQFRQYEDPVTHFVPPPAANVVNINQAKNGQIANGVYQYTPRQQNFASLGLPNAF